MVAGWPRRGLQWIGSNEVVLFAMRRTFALEVMELAARARLQNWTSYHTGELLCIAQNRYFCDKYIPTSA